MMSVWSFFAGILFGIFLFSVAIMTWPPADMVKAERYLNCRAASMTIPACLIYSELETVKKGQNNGR